MYPQPLTDQSQIWHAIEYTHSLHLHAKFNPNRFSVALEWRKPPNLAVISTLTFCDGATKRRSDKFEREWTTTILPISNGIKIVSIDLLKRLEADVVSTTLPFESVTNFFVPPEVKSQLIKLGVAREDPTILHL